MNTIFFLEEKPPNEYLPNYFSSDAVCILQSNK